MNEVTPKAIKRFRKAKDMTVNDLAKICGVSGRTVEGWEQGRPIGPAARKLLSDLLSNL